MGYDIGILYHLTRPRESVLDVGAPLLFIFVHVLFRVRDLREYAVHMIPGIRSIPLRVMYAL